MAPVLVMIIYDTQSGQQEEKPYIGGQRLASSNKINKILTALSSVHAASYSAKNGAYVHSRTYLRVDGGLVTNPNLHNEMTQHHRPSYPYIYYIYMSRFSITVNQCPFLRYTSSASTASTFLHLWLKPIPKMFHSIPGVFIIPP